MDTTKTRAGKRKKNTGSTRKELNDFEARLASQEAKMGHIDKKIDQIFQILLNRTDSVTMQNASEVCTDSQISVNNMNAVAVHDSNRENPAVLTGHDTHARGHFRCASGTITSRSRRCNVYINK